MTMVTGSGYWSGPAANSTQSAAPSSPHSIDDLERLFGGNTFGPEMALLLNQVKDANQRVADTLNRTNALRQMTDKMRAQIDRLRSYAAMIRERCDDDDDNPTISYKDLADAVGKDPEKVLEDLHEKKFKTADGQTVVENETKLYIVSSSGGPADPERPHQVCADRLEKEIQRLQGQIQRVDGLREAESMRIQEQLQLKQRMVTLATNILQTQHKALEAITNNTRA